MTSADAFGGRRVLVLGAAGFIGRHLVGELRRWGGEPVAVVRDATPVRWPLGEPARVVACDLADLDLVEALLEAERPDVLFNLAGYGVGPGERDEALSRRINAELLDPIGRVMGSSCPPGARRSLIHAGSAFEYGAVGGDLDEEGPARPKSVYGCTKLEGTQRVTRMGLQGVLNGVTARLFTVYGAGERPHRLLPSLLEAARRNSPVDLTAGAQQRDFTYVGDVAHGLCRLALTQGSPGEVVNLATGRLTSVRGFVEQAGDVLGIPAEHLRFGAVPSRSGEMAHAPPTMARLLQLTGWSPSTTVTEGIQRTWESDILWKRGTR